MCHSDAIGQRGCLGGILTKTCAVVSKRILREMRNRSCKIGGGNHGKKNGKEGPGGGCGGGCRDSTLPRISGRVKVTAHRADRPKF